LARNQDNTHLKDKAVPGSLEKIFKLGLGTLLRVQERKHDGIHAAHDPLVPWVLLAWLSQAVVVDDDARPRLESRDQVLEDSDGIRSRVVVDDPAEVVDCFGKDLVHTES
jgi:hypothetical protein